MNIKKFVLEKSDIQKSNTRKSNTQKKRSKKSAIFIALMFLALMSPKAWGYAEKDLPPSFSEELFSSEGTFSSGDTFFLSRGVLTDENGVAICQVNLVENPEFLPQFAEPGSSNTLKPLDLPDCEEQSLDIVAQYADQAWIKRDVAIAPWVAAGAFVGGCGLGFFAGWLEYNKNMDIGENKIFVAIMGGVAGMLVGTAISGGGGLPIMIGISTLGGLACYGVTNGIRMIYE